MERGLVKERLACISDVWLLCVSFVVLCGV